MTHTPNKTVSAAPSSRRAFLAAGGSLAMGFTIVPRHVLGGAGYLAPSERVNLAGIGAGGMGGGDIATHARNGANIVALCDVDDVRAAGSFQAFPKARRYKDFRVMLDKEAKHIDAVTVGTPDHIHAVAAMAAIRAGKHVYCQKPLTHTLHECRTLTKAAHDAGVATQMGNQGHATEGARLTNEWIQAGLIGEVREVHCWTDRAGLLWKQGIGRPKETPPVPRTLDWNLWLGPVHERPYNPAYAPHNWRGWRDFGTGAHGRHGLPHHRPSRVGPRLGRSDGDRSHVDARRFANRRQAELRDVSHRLDHHLRVPRTRHRAPRDDDLVRRGPDAPDAGRNARRPALAGNGVLYVGSKGKMFHSSHGGMPELLPVGLNEEAKNVPKTMARSPGHYEEWLAACKGGPRPVSNFDYAGPLTEIVLAGVLALRAPGRRLEWDSANLKVKNAPELNQYVHIEYRKGWTL